MTHIEMTATDAAKSFGTYVNTALRRPVIIKKNNKNSLLDVSSGSDMGLSGRMAV